MVHPYPPYCASFSYVGRHCYLLTFVTFMRMEAFRNAATVDLVWSQILRAGGEKGFEVIVYCFMPDHLHLIVRGTTEESRLKPFVKAAKQYSGFYYAESHRGGKLWQRYKDDRIIRDEADLRKRVRYVVNNPVAEGLVARPEDYPFLGSQIWSMAELLDYCKGLIGLQESTSGWHRQDLPPKGGSH